MEESKPVQPAVENVPQSAVPNPEVMQPAPGGIEQSPKSSESKMVMWLIGGLVVIILVVGGIYFYLNSQQGSQNEPAPTPAAKVGEDLETELNTQDVGDLDEEFMEVDKDLESL